MKPADELTSDDQSFCLAAENEVYVVFLKSGQGTTSINLGDSGKQHVVKWYDPRNGGGLQLGSVESISANGMARLGFPPNEKERDWVILIKRK